MAQARTYKTRALVLRKTKLGENDLVVTMLAQSGELLRAVAKGARKPGGSYAAKLELFSCIDLMLAKGKSLDVVTEARFAPGKPKATFGLEQAACASAVAELLADICQEGLEQGRMYEVGQAAFEHIARNDAPDSLAVMTAALLKIISFAGFRPSFKACALCGNEIGDDAVRVLFSVEDGGCVCRDCARTSEGVLADASTAAWAHALLHERFAAIPGLDVDVSTAFSVLQVAKAWLEFYTGRPLKSLAYIFTCGLF